MKKIKLKSKTINDLSSWISVQEQIMETSTQKYEKSEKLLIGFSTPTDLTPPTKNQIRTPL